MCHSKSGSWPNSFSALFLKKYFHATPEVGIIDENIRFLPCSNLQSLWVCKLFGLTDIIMKELGGNIAHV